MSYQVSRLTTIHSWLEGWQRTKCHLPLDTLQCLSFQSHPPLCLRDYRTGLTVKNSSYVQSWHLRTRGDGSVLLWLLIQWRLSATLQNIGIMFESQGVQKRGWHFFCLFVYHGSHLSWLSCIISFTLSLQFDRTSPCNVKQNSKLVVIFKYVKACHTE